MKVSVRFLLLFLFFAFFFLSFSRQTFAQQQDTNLEKSSNPTTNKLNTNPDVKINLHNATQIIMLETVSAMVCQLTGYDPVSVNHKCLGVDPSSGKIGFVENGGGVITLLGTMIDATFVPPASSKQYVAYLKNNFGIAKTAQAQGVCDSDYPRGFGFCGLQPIQALWIAMRNVVYLILILAFVLIGLGIMLRVHIDPRTVMTIQNQIPKIIVGILVITFSYAIAGFLIDVMYLTVLLFAGVISGAAGGIDNFNAIVNAANPFSAANDAFPGGILNIAGQSSAAFAELVKSVFNSQSSNFGGNVVGDIIGGIVGVIVNVLAFLIIAIALIIALIRLWVALVLTYINIILDIIFAPFWIFAGLLPGSSLGVGAWFRDLVANLAVFPVAISFFLIASVLVQQFNDTNSASRFIPPLAGGVNANATAAVIGLGFLLMLPNVLSIVKAALKAPKVNFGPVLQPVGAAGSTVKSLAGTAGAYYTSPIPGQRGGKTGLLRRAVGL